MSYTGVTFNGYHSYDDWGLRLTGITIEMPEAKTVYIDVPGMNGSLDLTETQNGGVKYQMRKLIFEFNARQCSYSRWTILLSKIAQAIEGQNIEIIIDFDSNYFYKGRCHISTQKTNEVLSQITIECNCNPYKMNIISSDEDWIWDTFSFEDGVINETSDITIDSEDDWQAVEVYGYPYNDTMVVVSDAEMTLKFDDTEYSISVGRNTIYDIELEEGMNYLYFQGSGTVTISYRGGRL